MDRLLSWDKGEGLLGGHMALWTNGMLAWTNKVCMGCDVEGATFSEGATDARTSERAVSGLLAGARACGAGGFIIVLGGVLVPPLTPVLG